MLQKELFVKIVIVDAFFFFKQIFAVAAYAWEAAPRRPLLTADENAVIESAVVTASSSLFQSATVLVENELLHCSVLLSGILKP